MLRSTRLAWLPSLLVLTLAGALTTGGFFLPPVTVGPVAPLVPPDPIPPDVRISWLEVDGMAPVAATDLIPPQAPRAWLLFIHGTSLHAAWYRDMARGLNTRGIAVRLLDLPGHGRSRGTRGHLPPGDAIDRVLEKALLELPDHHLPLYVGGHSLGADLVTRPELLGRMALADRPVSGLLLLAPYLARADIAADCPLICTMNSVNPAGLFADGYPTVRQNWGFAGTARDPLLTGVYDRTLLRRLFAEQPAAQRLATLPVPVLALIGDRDELISAAKLGQLFAAARPDRDRLTLLADTDHMGIRMRAVPDMASFILAAHGEPAESPPPDREHSR